MSAPSLLNHASFLPLHPSQSPSLSRQWPYLFPLALFPSLPHHCLIITSFNGPTSFHALPCQFLPHHHHRPWLSISHCANLIFDKTLQELSSIASCNYTEKANFPIVRSILELMLLQVRCKEQFPLNYCTFCFPARLLKSCYVLNSLMNVYTLHLKLPYS